MEKEDATFNVKVLSSVCRGLWSMYTDKQLCDIKVAVGDKVFDCHLLVLASVSGFFQSLISSSWQENRTGRVKIEHDDVTPESFQMLLDILYKTEDVITADTATDILRMSIFLQIKFLEVHCVEYLKTNLTPDVCVGIWMFAEKYHLPELAHTASAMASDQINKVVESGEILQLPKSMLLVILGSQKQLSMDDLCRTLLRWVQEDAETRQTYFGELLPFVSFPQLSPEYIHELMNYFKHPFFAYIAENIQEAVSFNLQNQTPELKRQLLAQQERVTTSPLIRKCGIVVGGSSAKCSVVKEMHAFSVEPGNKYYTYSLKTLPDSCEIIYATCVWRNELYVTYASKEDKKISLTKFVPAENEWQSLVTGELDMENCSMSAVNGKIYIIGDLRSRKKKFENILVYDVANKTVTRFKGRKSIAMECFATAVLGHRIYLFGGRDGSKTPVDTVQCLDTTSDQMYMAGKLPNPSAEVRALSDGGTTYVVCDGTQVLKMKEQFDIADRKEACLKKKISKDQLGGEQRELSTDDSPTTPSVVFVDVGTFTGNKILSAYLHNGELVACGNSTSNGDVLEQNVKVMNLSTGAVTDKRLGFKTLARNFILNTLNIPQEYLNEDKAVGHFKAGDQIKLKQGVRQPQPQYNQFSNYAANYSNFSYGLIGSVQNVDAHGNCTVYFANFQPYTVQASQLLYAN